MIGLLTYMASALGVALIVNLVVFFVAWGRISSDVAWLKADAEKQAKRVDAMLGWEVNDRRKRVPGEIQYEIVQRLRREKDGAIEAQVDKT